MGDMRVVVGGLRLRNPVIAASGTFGFGAEYAEIYDPARLGAVCTKGLTLMPRQGNPPPRLWETAGGLLNSIGLQNPGIEAFIREELPRMKAQGITVITNVWGNDPGEYERSVARLCDSSVDAIEINVSCPNVSRGGPVGGDAIRTAAGGRRSAQAVSAGARGGRAYRQATVGVPIPGLGKLVLGKRKARMGRNPATGEAIKIPAKTVLKFRSARAAKDAVL